MVTLDAIKLKIAKLEKQAATIAEKQTALGLTRIRELMHKHGLSIADIESFVGKRRGRKPGVKTANGTAKTARSTTKAVAPKYADPKSGATWSGRGRAPAWIKDVKDRSRFLIDGSGTRKATRAKAAPAKKAATRSANGAATRKRAAPARKRAASRAVQAAAE